MFLVKRIIMIMCAKNYKSKFKFLEVIQKKKCRLFFPDTVYIKQSYREQRYYEMFSNTIYFCKAASI